MKSYDLIERGYVLIPELGLGKQWEKVLEEVEEVKREIGVNKDDIYFKKDGTLHNLIMELLDIKLATDNMLNLIEKEYGKYPVNTSCECFDEKIEFYKNVKYNKELIK